MEQLNELAKTLGIKNFDLLLLGDGSGNTAEKPCGWYCMVYEPATGKCDEYFGGNSGGTNNYAELQPYLHALWVYHSTHPNERPRVAIVSDSQVTCRCGNKEYERRANGSLWASIEWFESKGFLLNWFHIFRNTNPFSVEADRVAGMVRKCLLSIRRKNGKETI